MTDQVEVRRAEDIALHVGDDFAAILAEDGAIQRGFVSDAAVLMMVSAVLRELEGRIVAG